MHIQTKESYKAVSMPNMQRDIPLFLTRTLTVAFGQLQFGYKEQNSAGYFTVILFLKEEQYLVLLMTFSRNHFGYLLSLPRIIFMIISTN